jgi:hypothetical protein
VAYVAPHGTIYNTDHCPAPQKTGSFLHTEHPFCPFVRLYVVSTSLEASLQFLPPPMPPPSPYFCTLLLTQTPMPPPPTPHSYALELEAYGDERMWDPGDDKTRAFENSRAFKVLQVRASVVCCHMLSIANTFCHRRYTLNATVYRHFHSHHLSYLVLPLSSSSITLIIFYHSHHLLSFPSSTITLYTTNLII